MNQKLCADCGKVIVNAGIGTGYALISKTQQVVCYECCGVHDRQTMIDTGHSRNLPLYLGLKKDAPERPRVTIRQWGRTLHNVRPLVASDWEVTNWPGTLRIPVSGISRGEHNIAGSRIDVWFNGPDGHVWHGVQLGESTQVVHCKRTRVRVKVRTA
jgi:hypothetical protein